MSSLDWVNPYLLPHPEDKNYHAATQRSPLSYTPNSTPHSSSPSTSSTSTTTNTPRNSTTNAPRTSLSTIDEKTPLIADDSSHKSIKDRIKQKMASHRTYMHN